MKRKAVKRIQMTPRMLRYGMGSMRMPIPMNDSFPFSEIAVFHPYSPNSTEPRSQGAVCQKNAQACSGAHASHGFLVRVWRSGGCRPASDRYDTIQPRYAHLYAVVRYAFSFIFGSMDCMPFSSCQNVPRNRDIHPLFDLNV